MSAAVVVPSLKLNNGHSMPLLGLGTYQTETRLAAQAVKDAIDAGYRHIDCALFYGNEKEVGAGIRAKIEDGTVTREQIFITTKLWNTFHSEPLVVPSCKKSLENLGLDYIDLYLVHSPMGFQEGGDLLPTNKDGEFLFTDVDYLETWRGMEECARQGLVRSIGISNFNSEQIKRLLSVAKIKPVNNQIEVNINFNQRKLIEFCKGYNITVTAYCPLGQPGNPSGLKNQLDNPKILEIARKYKKTPAQVALRYIVQLGAAPIPKSATKSRMQENINIFDFELSPKDVATIDSLGTGERVFAITDNDGHKYYPFSIPF